MGAGRLAELEGDAEGLFIGEERRWSGRRAVEAGERRRRRGRHPGDGTARASASGAAGIRGAWSAWSSAARAARGCAQERPATMAGAIRGFAGGRLAGAARATRRAGRDGGA